ncbi:hypothetical protein AAFF_G00166860 [Aldrovandia affinis]|uniref:Uncharacterized protein n=1 Tax=Aldrovandia affinis TaxID=143900 RepID=A0AAD7RMM5_9TELE|nr:hypothetical protein AAFF_G00166860 [Aldrovandia affinis]
MPGSLGSFVAPRSLSDRSRRLSQAPAVIRGRRSPYVVTRAAAIETRLCSVDSPLSVHRGALRLTRLASCRVLIFAARVSRFTAVPPGEAADRCVPIYQRALRGRTCALTSLQVRVSQSTVDE